MDNFCAKFNQLCGLAFVQPDSNFQCKASRCEGSFGICAFILWFQWSSNWDVFKRSSVSNWSTPKPFIPTFACFTFYFPHVLVWYESRIYESTINIQVGTCHFLSCLRLGTIPADLPLAGQKMRWALADLANGTEADRCIQRIDASLVVGTAAFLKGNSGSPNPKTIKARYFAISRIS